MRAAAQANIILAEMQAARSQVMAAIDGLSEEQIAVPGIDGWSVKDHLNHLTACDEFRFFEICRVSRDGGPAFAGMTVGQDDALNELIVTLRRSLPLSQVIADMEFARSLVVDAITGASERALDSSAYGDFQVDGSVTHDIEHANAVKAWRQGEGI